MWHSRFSHKSRAIFSTNFLASYTNFSRKFLVFFTRQKIIKMFQNHSPEARKREEKRIDQFVRIDNVPELETWIDLNRISPFIHIQLKFFYGLCFMRTMYPVTQRSKELFHFALYQGVNPFDLKNTLKNKNLFHRLDKAWKNVYLEWLVWQQLICYHLADKFPFGVAGITMDYLFNDACRIETILNEIDKSIAAKQCVDCCSTFKQQFYAMLFHPKRPKRVKRKRDL